MTDSTEEQTEKEEQQANQVFGGGSSAPKGVIALGSGELVVKFEGDGETSFSDLVNAIHAEAQHFTEDHVFITDERPRVTVVDPHSEDYF